MGILDKLFGRKQEKPQPTKAEPQKQNTQPTIQEKPEFKPFDFNKFNAELETQRQERENRRLMAIANCPGSEKYALNYQPQNSHAETLTITEFAAHVKNTFIAFDLETTGLEYKANNIIEIGACKVVNGEIVEEYSQLVKPYFDISPEATAVNGITAEMVADKPDILEVLPSFLTFIGDYPLAAHNVKFDYSFLANACMLNKFKSPETLFDTMQLARYYPDAGSKKLSAIVHAAGIEEEEAHRALGDARMVAKLILKTYAMREQKKAKPKAKDPQE